MWKIGMKLIKWSTAEGEGSISFWVKAEKRTRVAYYLNGEKKYGLITQAGSNSHTITFKPLSK